MFNRRHLLAGSAATLFAPRALAQAVKKPVHVIVGFPAGGGTDVTARVLAEALRGAYASTVLVENKPGASARLAFQGAGQPAFARHGMEYVNRVAVNPDKPECVACIFGSEFLKRTIERFLNWFEQDGSGCGV